MITLKIAELGIAADGFDFPYFRKRTMEYQEPFAKSDLKITCRMLPHIPKPAGAEIAACGERHFLRIEQGYGLYDSAWLNGEEVVVASITANRDWSVVEAALRDVEQCGGAPSDVRSFHLLGEVFRWFLPFHEGIVLHSSCLLSQGSAMAFSAPSGTGKSTHTGLWRKYFTDVTMMNDDSPAVRKREQGMIAYGTPWSGKTEINHNLSAPLKAIVFLEQAKENRLQRLSNREISFRLLRELARPVFPELLQQNLNFLEQMIGAVPAYLLQCTISEEAARLSHRILEGD